MDLTPPRSGAQFSEPKETLFVLPGPFLDLIALVRSVLMRPHSSDRIGNHLALSVRILTVTKF